jgi:hypothetical protein
MSPWESIFLLGINIEKKGLGGGFVKREEDRQDEIWSIF